METVTVSPDFQVVIPESFREALGIRPGQKVRAIRYGNRIELIPCRTLAEARGFLADYPGNPSSKRGTVGRLGRSAAFPDHY